MNPEIFDALNMLLEDERASVEIEVALANGATEQLEREAFTIMGTDEVIACCALRERFELAGETNITPRINGVVFQILNAETYAERLRAFAEYKTAIAGRIEELLATIRDDEIRKTLNEILVAHARDASWCAQRAEAFAQSRVANFREIPSPAPLVPLRAAEHVAADPPPDSADDNDDALDPPTKMNATPGDDETAQNP